VGSVDVFVDGVRASQWVSINSTHVTIGHELLSTTGEHAIKLKTSAGATFLCRIVNVETPLSGVLLNADSLCTQVNHTVEFYVSVQHGDNVFVNLSFGDGSVELRVVQSSPLILFSGRFHT